MGQLQPDPDSSESCFTPPQQHHTYTQRDKRWLSFSWWQHFSSPLFWLLSPKPVLGALLACVQPAVWCWARPRATVTRWEIAIAAKGRSVWTSLKLFCHLAVIWENPFVRAHATPSAGRVASAWRRTGCSTATATTPSSPLRSSRCAPQRPPAGWTASVKDLPSESARAGSARASRTCPTRPPAARTKPCRSNSTSQRATTNIADAPVASWYDQRIFSSIIRRPLSVDVFRLYRLKIYLCFSIFSQIRQMLWCANSFSIFFLLILKPF